MGSPAVSYWQIVYLSFKLRKSIMIKRLKCANKRTSGFIDMTYDVYSLVPEQVLIQKKEHAKMILSHL